MDDARSNRSLRRVALCMLGLGLAACGCGANAGNGPDQEAAAGGSGGLGGSGGAGGSSASSGAGGSGATGGGADSGTGDSGGPAGMAGTSGGAGASGSGGAGGSAATDGSAAAGGSDGSAGCGGSAGTLPPSCVGLPETCGPSGNASCCASCVVPGGTFNRSNDPAYPATVSDFRLDVYEITVGRFRNFVAAYPGNMPAAGSGKNPNNPSDPGWDAAWNASMPADQFALILTLENSGTSIMGFETWTNSPGGNENRPINSITWLEAFAFCIWDGGRLPTEAEWNYAAAGGSEQRAYPWSSPPASTTIDET